MKLVYLGTPYFSGQMLQYLASDQQSYEVAAVITQPDQPFGRKKVVTPSPVKETALKNGIQVFHSFDALEELKPDIAVLFAYGEIIPERVLSIPKHGFWNIHPSLLPNFRGASPITYPLFLQEKKTGVTLMQMDKDLDHGPIIGTTAYDLQETDTRAYLERHFTEMAFQLFKKHLSVLQANGYVQCQNQDHSQATFTRPLNRNDGYITQSLLTQALKGEIHDRARAPEIIREYLVKHALEDTYMDRYTSSAHLVWSLFRAFQGWPGLWTTIHIENRETRLKLLDMKYEEDTLILLRVQLEGKTPVDFKTFQNAYSLF